MQAQRLPMARPFLSAAAFTFAGSMCDGSSTGISTVSKPHFLNLGKCLVLSVMNGDVNKKVLMPSLIKFFRVNLRTRGSRKRRGVSTACALQRPARHAQLIA